MNATRNPVVAAVADASDEMMALDQASPNPTPVTTTAEDAQEVGADLRKLIDSAPAHIWLDLGEGLEALTDEGTFRDLREVSWSEDNATGVGIKYVRAPVAVATSDAERAALPPAFAKLADAKTLAKVLKMNIVNGVLAPLAAELLQSLEEMVLAAESLPIDFKQATDQGGWQPIATAPKDGTVIVVYATGQNDEGDDGPCVDVACWSKDDYGFMPHDEDEAEALRPCVLDPSHWMPVIDDNFAPHSEATPTLLDVADGDAVGGKSGAAA